MMQLGVDGVFVGSGIFKSEDPATMARAIVEATTHFQDPDVVAKVSRGARRPDAGPGDRHARDAPAGPRLVTHEGGRARPAGRLPRAREAFAALGATPVEVRTPAQLAEVDCLAIPGGESTTIGKLARAYDLIDPVRERAAAGMPILGTCAGMIVLAHQVDGGTRCST